MGEGTKGKKRTRLFYCYGYRSVIRKVRSNVYGKVLKKRRKGNEKANKGKKIENNRRKGGRKKKL